MFGWCKELNTVAWQSCVEFVWKGAGVETRCFLKFGICIIYRTAVLIKTAFELQVMLWQRKVMVWQNKGNGVAKQRLLCNEQRGNVMTNKGNGVTDTRQLCDKNDNGVTNKVIRCRKRKKTTMTAVWALSAKLPYTVDSYDWREYSITLFVQKRLNENIKHNIQSDQRLETHPSQPYLRNCDCGRRFLSWKHIAVNETADIQSKLYDVTRHQRLLLMLIPG